MNITTKGSRFSGAFCLCERCAEIVGVDVQDDPLQASRRNAPSRVILNGVISCRLFSGRRGRRPLQMRANIDDKISKFKTVCGGRGEPSPTSAVRYNYPLNQKRQTLSKKRLPFFYLRLKELMSKRIWLFYFFLGLLIFLGAMRA